MYVDISVDGADELGDRLAATEVAAEELSAAAIREWMAKFGKPYASAAKITDIPEGYVMVGAVGMQLLIAGTTDELSLDTVVWPYPMFGPDWADGFTLGALFARFWVTLSADAKARFVGDVPES